MSSEQISNFLDAAIRNRIAVRMIAEQHIVLSHALQNPEQTNVDVGIVNMALSPVEMIRMCGSFVSELCEASLGAAPSIIIDGATDATFACVPIFPSIPNFFPISQILKETMPPKLCPNTHGIYPDRDPQERIPRDGRATSISLPQTTQ
jgi:hypothetical protein